PGWAAVLVLQGSTEDGLVQESCAQGSGGTPSCQPSPCNVLAPYYAGSVEAGERLMATSRQVESAQRRPLAACIVAMFPVSGADTYANTIAVVRCDDDNHVGDLRHAIAGVVNDGDIVDMSTLACSPITLHMGELATSRDITLQGPADHSLSILGKYNGV